MWACDRLSVKKNYFRIFGDLFYCQTENGFNNAIYEITDPGKVENKKFYRRMVTSWPKEYPALVSFCDNSFEEGRIYVQWVPVTDLNLKRNEYALVLAYS